MSATPPPSASSRPCASASSAAGRTSRTTSRSTAAPCSRRRSTTTSASRSRRATTARSIVRSLDLGHLVEYHLDEGPEYDGVMDLAKAAIDRIGVPRRDRDGHRLGRSRRQRPRRLVGARDGAWSPASPMLGERRLDAHELARALLLDRTRRPGDQRRVAGPVRRRVRRVQPVRVLAAGRAGLARSRATARRRSRASRSA